MKVDVQGYTIDTALSADNPLYWTLGAILGAGVAAKIIGWLYGTLKLKGKRSKKRKQREEALKKLEESISKSKLSADQIQDIVHLDLPSLQAKLKSGELAPTQVLHAYQAKALEAHKKTNCLVEPIVEAEEWAAQLEKGEKRGVLYGIPVSIKDNYGIKGYDSTIGCSNWIDRPFSDDAVMVKVLKAAGAIPFVKTNVPQTMISYETSNPIFGTTCNPQDTSRGAGGSSGGEGALIGAGGSLLGVGSDIGGSIRIPASMNGICGFKPTAGRISTDGTHPNFKGQTNVRSTYGPMARDVDSLVTAMSVLCDPAAWTMDSTVPPLPFDMETYKKRDRKLRIGILMNDPFFDAVPAMQRAVKEAEHKLKGLGYEVVPWYMADLTARSLAIFASSIFGDGGQMLRELLKHDVSDMSTAGAFPILYFPVAVKRVIAFLLKPFAEKIALMISNSYGMNVGDWWKLIIETKELRDEVIQSWKDLGIDAVVCPGFACLPQPLGDAPKTAGTTIYTMMYNVLNFPAGTLPVTRVTKEDVDKIADYPASDPWQKVVKKGMEGTEGLIVNVQVATLPWREELCLRIMKDLEEAVQFKRDF